MILLLFALVFASDAQDFFQCRVAGEYAATRHRKHVALAQNLTDVFGSIALEHAF